MGGFVRNTEAGEAQMMEERYMKAFQYTNAEITQTCMVRPSL